MKEILRYCPQNLTNESTGNVSEKLDLIVQAHMINEKYRHSHPSAQFIAPELTSMLRSLWCKCIRCLVFILVGKTLTIRSKI